MNFQLIGVNHNSAPIDLREKLAIPHCRLPQALQRLAQHPGVAGGLILSTCNRVEIIVESNSAGAGLRSFLSDYFGIALDEMEPHLYEYRQDKAVLHLFRVAASLDSMVVGEAQILGQVKEAYAVARAVGTISPQLHRLLRRTLTAAKRVRRETAVGSCAVSVASVAVELAQNIFGSLENKRVYLVGAGEMSELAARHLIARGASSILVSSCSYERATKLATAVNGEAVRFEDLYNTCHLADIIITSTAAPHPIFRREHGKILLQRRQNRPLFFIDISVPRNVDPEMNKLEGIFVYDMDDLQQTVHEHAKNRRKEAERAEAIIASEVERFRAGLQVLDVVPAIVSLQERVEQIRQSEIDRARGRLGQLSVEQEAAIDAITRGIVNKLMHSPITALKSAAREAEADALITLVERLFDISGDRTIPSSRNTLKFQPSGLDSSTQVQEAGQAAGTD